MMSFTLLPARSGSPAAGHVGQPAHHLHHLVQRGAVLVGARQKAGVVHIDQARVEPRQAGMVQAVLLHHPGLEVLQHHVGARGQPDGGLHALGLAQVDGHALLVAVEHGKETRPGAQQVARAVAVHRLHLDHLGPQIRQHHAARRPHHHVAELHHANALQRQRLRRGGGGAVRR